MSLSDCEKCWETPCTCGYGYRNWSKARLRELIKVLTAVLNGTSSYKPDAPEPKMTAQELKRTVEIAFGDLEPVRKPRKKKR